VIGRSGDREKKLTAETRRRGENQKSTTEVGRHGERSGDLVIARDRVIGLAAGSDQFAIVEHAIYLCHPERVGADATASRRTPTKTVPELAASGSLHETANLTAESRSRGENQKSTTEVGRHGEERKCSDFPDHQITRDHRITRSFSVPARLASAMRTLRATLREIFDESAYDRFLLRTKTSRSTASYREFMRERDAAIVKKPRCC
jgi:hypothetical protein